MAEEIINRLLQQNLISEEEADILRNHVKNLDDLKDFYYWKAWKHGEVYVAPNF